MIVHRMVDRPDGSKLLQTAHVIKREDGKGYILSVNGMSAVGKDAKPKTFKTPEAVVNAGWLHGLPEGVAA